MPKRVAAFSPKGLSRRPLLRKASEKNRPTAFKGYNSKAWAALRKRSLVKVIAISAELAVASVQVRAKLKSKFYSSKCDGGLDKLENLQVLCIRCHGAKTNQEQEGGKRKMNDEEKTSEKGERSVRRGLHALSAKFGTNPASADGVTAAGFAGAILRSKAANF